MIGDIVGYVKVVDNPEHTEYLFGGNFEISGRTLPVWERNPEGDCLCIVPEESNLVSIDYRDIKEFVECTESNPENALISIFQKLKGC